MNRVREGKNGGKEGRYGKGGRKGREGMEEVNRRIEGRGKKKMEAAMERRGLMERRQGRKKI